MSSFNSLHNILSRVFARTRWIELSNQVPLAHSLSGTWCILIFDPFVILFIVLSFESCLASPALRINRQQTALTKRICLHITIISIASFVEHDFPLALLRSCKAALPLYNKGSPLNFAKCQNCGNCDIMSKSSTKREMDEYKELKIVWTTQRFRIIECL